MPDREPTEELDPRFSSEDAAPTVTPLASVWMDEALSSAEKH